MPGSLRSLELTNAYRAHVGATRDAAVAAVVDRWQGVDVEDLDRSVRAWLSGAIAVVAAAQARAVRLSDAYLAAFLSRELAEAVPPTGLDSAGIAGATADGRPVALPMLGAAAVVRRARARGVPGPAALASGMARAVRVTRSEVMDAGRTALDVAMATENRVVGWRRVTSGRPCGACLAAATGAIQHTAETLHVHPSCRCTKEPVVRGVREQVRRPTGRELFEDLSRREQDRLFAGTGGAAKAELVRTGSIELEDLITRPAGERSAHVGITETPLAALGGRT